MPVLDDVEKHQYGTEDAKLAVNATEAEVPVMQPQRNAYGSGYGRNGEDYGSELQDF